MPKKFPRKNVVRFQLKHIPTEQGAALPQSPTGDENDYCSDNDYDDQIEKLFSAKNEVHAPEKTTSISKVPVSGTGGNLDEHFEAMFEREYANDTEIGALDLNNVQGNSELQDLKQVRNMITEVKMVRNTDHGDDYEPEIVSDHHKYAIIGDEAENTLQEEDDMVELEIKMRENRIDCESILTFNSTLYNHPKLIVEPRRRRVSQMSTQSGQDHKNESDGDDHSTVKDNDTRSMASTRLSVLSRLSIRPPEESTEEKRARKKALKTFRQERRQERKANQAIFKLEEKNVLRQQGQIPAIKLV